MSSIVSPPVPDDLRREGGHAMAVSIFVVLILMSLGFTMLSSVTSAKQEASTARESLRQLHLAESALEAAIANLRAGATGNVGSHAAPIAFGGGEYWTETTDHGDDTYTVLAIGRYGRYSRVIQGRVRASDQAFHHAVFAGNSSDDSDYVLEFGGQGSHGDEINGDVFSGGDLAITEDASVTGDLRATGEITGGTGEEGVSQPGFDFSGIDFSDPSIVNVAAEFAAHGAPVDRPALGGTAIELAATHASHIFRLNPSDRAPECGGTTKDDYFMEDPYEPVVADPGAPPLFDFQSITMDEGSGATRRVYYIDGNLWVHNRVAIGGVAIQTAAGSGVQVTFIVRGNVIFSDDFVIENDDLDGVAFIALVDPDVPDSGNVVMGDPIFGTLAVLEAYLYAENDFVDVNLSATGSKEVHVTGAMTAGNHVAIDRTYGPGADDHSKLTVDWDVRYSSGTLNLPLVSAEFPARTFHLEAWAEAAPGTR